MSNAAAKKNDFIKRLLNFPATLDLIIALPLCLYAIYSIADGMRGTGLMLCAISFCFAGLGINAAIRKMRELKILEQYSSPGTIRKLDESRFERILRAYYMTTGFMIEEPELGTSHEYDFILVKAKDRLLVRDRDWMEDVVSLETLKKVWYSKRPVKATGVVIFTNGKFVDDALDWGRKQNIEMMTGHDFEEAVRKIVGAPAVLTKQSELSETNQEGVQGQPVETVSQAMPYFIFLDLNVIDKGIDLLRELLKRYPAYSIVVTTKRDIPEHEIAEMLDGMDFEGKTPELPQYGASARYYEIVNFLAGRELGHNAKWIAIDQDPRAFPEGCDELVLVSPHQGINEKIIIVLEEKMKKISSASL